jgi:L-threonylcarbamoyladenylate synthase
MTSPRIVKINPLNPEPDLILRIAEALRRGQVFAYPTETFYGLGADAGNEAAIEKIFLIKGRNFNNPIPVIIGTREDLNDLVTDIPEVAQELIDAFWPGPLTLVFRASKSVSPQLTANTGFIGIRISSNPIARMLAQTLGRPLTATSANISGEKESTTANEVSHALGPTLDGIVDGERTPGLKGSTIIDVASSPPQILRIGVISEIEIGKVLNLSKGKNT